MEGHTWFGENWFTLLQSAGIVAGLVFNAVSLRRDGRSRKVANLLIMTQHHREIWAELYRRPELSRVLAPHPDLEAHPVTETEELFVRLLILHLASVHRAASGGELVKIEGLKQDVRWFLTLPIPTAVWQRFKSVQDADFVAFVESSLRTAGER